jgi:hypothetical protein
VRTCVHASFLTTRQSISWNCLGVTGSLMRPSVISGR